MCAQDKDPTPGSSGPGFKPGDRVWVGCVQAQGVVQSVSARRARAAVDLGKVTVNVRMGELEPARSGGDERRFKPPVRVPNRRRDVPLELDLHGCRVEDALARVDQFVDDAVMAGHAAVRIVHGHGTGALRAAIHRHLAALGVRGYRLGEAGMDEGASGVTIVTL